MIGTPVAPQLVTIKAREHYKQFADYADNLAISLSVVGEFFNCPLHGFVIRPDGLAAFSMPILCRGQLSGFFCAAFPRTALHCPRHMGVNSMLCKPFDVDDLLAAVGSLEPHGKQA